MQRTFVAAAEKQLRVVGITAEGKIEQQCQPLGGLAVEPHPPPEQRLVIALPLAPPDHRPGIDHARLGQYFFLFVVDARFVEQLVLQAVGQLVQALETPRDEVHLAQLPQRGIGPVAALHQGFDAQGALAHTAELGIHQAGAQVLPVVGLFLRGRDAIGTYFSQPVAQLAQTRCHFVEALLALHQALLRQPRLFGGAAGTVLFSFGRLAQQPILHPVLGHRARYESVGLLHAQQQ